MRRGGTSAIRAARSVRQLARVPQRGGARFFGRSTQRPDKLPKKRTATGPDKPPPQVTAVNDYRFTSQDTIVRSAHWDDMSPGVQRSWSALGWDCSNWEHGHSDTESLDWKDLSSGQQDAARAVGFTDVTWDSEEDESGSKDSCSVM